MKFPDKFFEGKTINNFDSYFTRPKLSKIIVSTVVCNIFILITSLSAELNKSVMRWQMKCRVRSQMIFQGMCLTTAGGTYDVADIIMV
jgi:hypothetical protein